MEGVLYEWSANSVWGSSCDDDTNVTLRNSVGRHEETSQEGHTINRDCSFQSRDVIDSALGVMSVCRFRAVRVQKLLIWVFRSLSILMMEAEALMNGLSS